MYLDDTRCLSVALLNQIVIAGDGRVSSNVFEYLAVLQIFLSLQDDAQFEAQMKSSRLRR